MLLLYVSMCVCGGGGIVDVVVVKLLFVCFFGGRGLLLFVFCKWLKS